MAKTITQLTAADEVNFGDAFIIQQSGVTKYADKTKVLNGIVNGHVDESAAILGTKIAPDFGSQNVVTTGTLTTGTLTAGTPSVLGATAVRQAKHINGAIVDAALSLVTPAQGVFSINSEGSSSPPGAASVALVRGRGTLGAPGLVSDGDWLGAITYQGHDGTSPIIAAKIQGEVDGETGTNDMPGRLVFSTTADGASAPSERMRLTKDGAFAVGTATPDGAAIVDVSSTTRGFLPPRMTTAQRNAISSPPAGLMIYNTSTNKLNVRTASSWEAVTSS